MDNAAPTDGTAPPHRPPPGIRGLLLLDVDGPLNPYGAKAKRRPAGYRSYRYTRDGRWYSGSDFRRHKGTRVWLNPHHGARILDLAADTKLQPVWASTWRHEANTLVSPAVGLPTLPIIDFPAADLNPDGTTRWRAAGRWKYRGVSAFAGTLPLAWLDDEHDLRIAAADELPGAQRDLFLRYRTAARDGFLFERGAIPTLLCQVDPKTGLGEVHLAKIRDWATTLPDGEHRIPSQQPLDTSWE
jgi:hypothetical protein